MVKIALILRSFLICKEPRECSNQHLFCSNCILTWSTSLASESRAKCPVCRTEGRYRLNTAAEKLLCNKHVKCPETDCAWAGKLTDYRWHRRRHDRQSARRAPTPVRRRQSEHEVTPGSLSNSLDAFASRLHARRRNIQQHMDAQAHSRRESMEEVENLSRRLGRVADDIVHLLDNMQHDSRRYQQYLHDSDDLLPAIEPSTSRARTPGASAMTSSSDARLERLMYEPSAAANTFTSADRQQMLLPAEVGYTGSESGYPREAIDQLRIQRLLTEPTPTSNPFRLPETLPMLNPPAAWRNPSPSPRPTSGSTDARATGEQSASRHSASRSSARRSTRNSHQ